MKIFRAIVLVALSCTCASNVSAATRVFYDGSEAGNTDLWSQADYRDKCTSVTSAADGVTGPYSGSRMIRCNTDGTVAWNTPKWFETMALNSFPYTNEFLFRAEVRVDKNHARSGDSPKKILRWFTGSIDYFDSIHDSSGFKNEGPITSGSYWGDAPGDNTASSQKWGKVEVYYNSSNRKLREWHDDVLIRDETTGNLGGKWYPLYITSNYEQVPSGDSLNYVYFDDVEIYSDATSGTPSASGTMANGDVLVSGGSGGTSDTTPPSSPTNLAANATSASGISVSWNSATDNVGVVGYQIERCTGLSCSNFTQVGTPSSSPFVDSNLSASTGYSYHVRAVDAAGNTSSWSNVVGATTQDVAQTPTVTLSANPASIASGSSSVLTWSSANATSCTASGSWSGTKSTSGTQSVSPTSTSTYTLTCTGTGGSANQSVTVTVSDPNEVIIDNTDTASVSSSGSWLPSTAYPGYYGSDYFYSSTTAGEWFQWTASSLVPGTYEVYARWLAVTGRPTDVNYQVTHASGAATVGPVNQEINGSQWNLLGTYSFNTTGAVKVIGTATGWEGTAADAVRFLKVTSSTPQPCSTVTPTNFTTSTYTGYGAPYDVFVSNTPLISTTCTSSDTRTINATLGITGDTTRIVYTKGYYYDPGISDWTSFTGTCTGALNGDWCQGSVSATLTDTDISTASASDPAYLVGMTCSIQGGRWKCGCRDTTCSTFYWQVQGAGM